MAKYNDLLNAVMGVSAEKTNSRDMHKDDSEIPGTPINAPIAVSSSSYYPFDEELEMGNLEDSGSEEGNLTNMEVGATTGEPIDEEEDQQLKLKLEALKQLK
jgi:hypothetical protein